MTTSEDNTTTDRPFKVEFELAEELAWTIREQAPWRELIKKLGERVPDRDKLPLTLELSVGEHPLVRVVCGTKGSGMWSLHNSACSDFDKVDPNYDPAAYADII